MSTIFSKLWPGLALAIILALAVLLAFKSCQKPVPGPDASQQVMAAVKAGYDSARRVDSPQLVALTRQKDSVSMVLDSVLSDLDHARADLQDRAAALSQTLASGDDARVLHDTIRIVQNCDSLRAEVKSGVPAVQGYMLLTDSAIATTVARAIIQDSIISKLSRDVAAGRAAITAQQLQYEIVHKDDASKTAQLRVYRPVAIGGVGILAAIIVLKFILH